jgi:putative phosphoesterase
MRIAIISDIHGDLVSLNTTLADIEKECVDQILCLGDVVLLGPQPHEVVHRLKALGCLTILGNTDTWFLNPEVDEPTNDRARRVNDIALWNLEQLTPDDLNYIRTFKPTLEIALGDGASLLCFHGSPHSDTDVIVATTPDADLDRVLSGFHATVMAGGHTHVQMLRRYQDMLIINPGSVCLPYVQLRDDQRDPPWAEYALVGWEDGRLGIELRRVPVDVAAVVQAIRDSGMPHADWLSKDWC